MVTKEKSKAEYNSRINKVINFIDSNIDRQLDLNSVAEVANFSPFHFHRIFTFLMGETPVDYIQRIRIEKSAPRLKDSSYGSITEIAYSCGFGSVSLFSRTFKKYFGITPTEFSKTEKPAFSQNGVFFSKNGQRLSKNLKNVINFDSDICNVELNKFIIMETKIEVKKMPDMQVIYCRHIGPFCQIGGAFEKVIKWAVPRKLYDPSSSKTIAVTHDDPSVTLLKK